MGANATLDSSVALNLANDLNLGAGAALDLLGSQNVSLGGLISGTGSLVKNGTATLALNGANTFSGGVGLNAGVLQLGNAQALGTGQLDVGGNASLDATAALSVGNTLGLAAAPTSPCWAAMT